MDKYTIVRYGEPSKYDHAPYGSSCKCLHHDDTFKLYIQLSSDEENPRWEYMGTFNEGDHICDKLQV